MHPLITNIEKKYKIQRIKQKLWNDKTQLHLLVNTKVTSIPSLSIKWLVQV